RANLGGEVACLRAQWRQRLVDTLDARLVRPVSVGVSIRRGQQLRPARRAVSHREIEEVAGRAGGDGRAAQQLLRGDVLHLRLLQREPCDRGGRRKLRLRGRVALGGGGVALLLEDARERLIGQPYLGGRLILGSLEPRNQKRRPGRQRDHHQGNPPAAPDDAEVVSQSAWSSCIH